MSGKTIFFIVALLCIFILLESSYKIVSPGNVGIRVTMGSVSPNPVPQGVVFKMPLLTTIEEYSIRQTTNETNAQCFSSDLQQVNCRVKVLSRPAEDQVITLYQKYQDDVFQSLVLPRVQEAIKEATANNTAEQIVKQREAVKQTALASARSKIGNLVVIDDLVIENIELTKDLENAIEMKMVQEQEASKSKFVQDKAKIDAETKVITARGEAEAISIQGEALMKTPDLIQLKIVEKWDGRSPLVVGDVKGANILLPIDSAGKAAQTNP